MKISDIIFMKRKQLGLTLEQVGHYVGVGKSTVKKWENGSIANIRRDKIAKLAEILELNPIALITGCVEPEPSLLIHQNSLPQKATLNDKELELIHSFRRLNDAGQSAAIAMVNGLTAQEAYKSTSVQNNKIG